MIDAEIEYVLGFSVRQTVCLLLQAFEEVYMRRCILVKYATSILRARKCQALRPILLKIFTHVVYLIGNRKVRLSYPRKKN